MQKTTGWRRLLHTLLLQKDVFCSRYQNNPINYFQKDLLNIQDNPFEITATTKRKITSS